MRSESETTALVALLRTSRRSWKQLSAAVSEAGVEAVLDVEAGLLTAEALENAASELAGWTSRGISVASGADPGYPQNLQTVPGRPPLIFVKGRLEPSDERSVSLVGTRRASDRGRRAARAIAQQLSTHGYAVVSGLAAGIDTEAHGAALETGGRTIAVIGTGLDECYPPQNARLQETIADVGAVVSQFWPESGPSRHGFPMRNGVMAGMTLATVIVEASHTSGTRIQARLALAAGRQVLLLAPLLAQPWAVELASQPGVTVVHSPAEVTEALHPVAPAALVG